MGQCLSIFNILVPLLKFDICINYELKKKLPTDKEVCIASNIYIKNIKLLGFNYIDRSHA